MVQDILNIRGNNYGNFHTQANLTQTLNAVFTQHYMSVHKDEEGKVTPLPHFMAEAVHMICHKLARIANGNPYYDDSWQDIAGYSQLVVNILQQAAAEAQQKQQAAKEAVEIIEPKGDAND